MALGGLRLLGTIEKWFSRILEPARAIAGRTQAKGAWQSTAWSAAKPANAMGIVEAIESTEPEPLCVCSTGGGRAFFELRRN
jgi:hypothetical protein